MLVNSDIKIRLEHFGALAKDMKDGSFYEFRDHSALLLTIFKHLKNQKLTLGHVNYICEESQIPLEKAKSIISTLVNQKVLNTKVVDLSQTQEISTEESIKFDVKSAIKYYHKNKPEKPIVKPFWSHLQPFTRCNQKCIHCYCKGGPNAEPFALKLEQWYEIIDRLSEFGVFDVYITGGENFIYEEFFSIAEYILSKRLGFGLSTNATLVTRKNIERLKKLKLKRIQVSLDGATAETYKFIRGVDMFRQAVQGIEKLSEFVEPVINTVVNKKNINELESIIKLCSQYGVTRYKFFPQKNCGRTIENSEIVYNDKDIQNIIIPKCEELAQKHGVEIETLGKTNCGSGTSGFAVDHFGFAYPCIFGVEDSTQKIGNVLSEDLNHIWFVSNSLNKFRQAEGGKFCHRCETPLAA